MRKERHTQLSPLEVYRLLLLVYGRQDWKPEDSPFEMMLKAILSQDVGLEEVSQVTALLQEHKLLDFKKLAQVDVAALHSLLAGVGVSEQKATHLTDFAKFYSRYGTEKGMKRWPTTSIRSLLLQVSGVDSKTADAFLLYALDKPTFIVSDSIKQVFSRIGQFASDSEYHDAKELFMNYLPHDLSIFKELNALINKHTDCYCGDKPRCQFCPLGKGCLFGKNAAVKRTPAQAELVQPA